MKKLILLALGIVILSLSACGNTASKDTEFYDCEEGFTGILGNKVYESPDGYYFLMNNYLMFADENLEQKVFVCNKAECLHDQESPENKVNCDAFFGRANSVRYYNDKIYVLANSLKNQDNYQTSVYELNIDGSNRKVIYSSKNDMMSMIIHRGQAYIYEEKYTDENGNMSENPILSVFKFDLKKPNDTETVFETKDYQDAGINYMKCYQDALYFYVFGDSVDNFICKIDLESGEAEKYEYGFYDIGKDSMFCTKTISSNLEEMTWEDEYMKCDMNGNVEQQLTKEKFPILEENVSFLCADENYLYFQDIDYGGNMVPLEERKIHVCTYQGDVAGEITYGNQGIEYFYDFYSGNDKYLFFYEQKENSISCYYVEKEKIKNGASFELLYSAENGVEFIQ